ncbi:hypothetical protein GW17_00053746 [Ensete ventricosum]|nr:hypothetical protein GW17_00053746 [Ensete ventricosum]RZS07000.1 hypothetical protein BHM03_00037758 [Ensete ventricosum]
MEFGCRRNVGSGGDMHNHHGDGDNFLQVLTSKSLSTRNQMSNPACEYLKKLDSSFDFPNPLSLNTFEKHLSSYNGSTNQDERTPQLDRHIAPSSCSSPMTPFMVQYSTSRITPIKHELPTSPSYPGDKSARERRTSYKPHYDRNIEGESEHQDMEAPTAFLPPPSSNGFGYQFGVSSLSDLISFGDCVNRPSMELRPSRSSYLKGSDSSYGRIQGHDDKDFVDGLLSFLTLPIGTISFAEQQTSSLPWVAWLSSTGGLSASPQQAVLEGRGEQADAASSEEFICN